MNILISVNKSYLDKAQTMLFSLREHNNGDITVFLFNHSLCDQDVSSFSNYLKENCDINLVAIDVKKTEFDNMPLGDLHFSVEMYYRILAQFFLPEDLDRILWLDADIVILKDLSSFYSQEFDNSFYVVCADRDCDSENAKRIKQKLGIDQRNIYFNSGVLLINLEQLRNNTTKREIVSISNSLRDKLTYPDQDLLNYLYNQNVKYADYEVFNYQVKDDVTIPKEKKDRIAILHYSGSSKPWIYSQIRSSSLPYWQIRYRQGLKKEVKNVYKNLIIDRLYCLFGYIYDYIRLRKKK